MLSRVSRLLSVQPHERPFITASAVLVLLVMAVNVLVLGTVTALFLASSTRAQLPVVYAASAVFGMAATSVVSARAGTVSRSAEVGGVLWVLACGLVAAFVALPYAPRAFLFVVHPVATGLAALAVVQAFALVNDCLDAEQAKRVLPTIGAGGTLGAMAAGGLMAWLAPRFGTDKGLVLAAVLAVTAAWLAKRLLTRHFAQLGGSSPPPATATARAPGQRTHVPGTAMAQSLLGSRLLVNFAALQVVVLAASTCLKFALESSLQAQLGVDHIARFLGLLNLAANGAVLLVQVFFEARLLSTFGLWPGLLAVPSLLVAGACALLVSPSLLVLAAVRFGETLARFSVARTAEDLALLPLPSEQRRRGKTFIASTVAPAAVLLGSLLIAAVDAWGSTLSYVAMLVLGLGALALVRTLRAPYLEQLHRTLSRRRVTTARFTHVPSQDVAATLLGALPGSEGTARMNLLRGLLRHRAEGTQLVLPKGLVAKELAVELAVGHRLRLLRAALAKAAAPRARERAMSSELDFQEERVHESLFALLALIHPPEDMQRARLGHLRGDRRVRAFALELLSQVLDAGMRKDVLPYLSNATAEEHLQRAAGVLDVDRAVPLVVLLQDAALPLRLRLLALYAAAVTPRDSEEAMLMNTVDQVLALRSVELFSRLSSEELQAIADLTERKQLSEGERVFAEGDPGDAFYVVMSGELQVTRGGAAVATLRAGECFGEMALLDQGLRSATVTAGTDVELSRIGDDDFRELLERTPSIAMAMLAILARRAASLLERSGG